MNLKLPKRTTQLDNDREVLLGYDNQGGVIWTTKGANKLTGDQKHEVSAKLAAQRKQAAISKTVEAILKGAGTFLETSILELAPKEVFDSYLGDRKLFATWLNASGFGFRQDGLKSVLLYHDREVGSVTAKCDPFIENDVLLALKFEQVMERAKK